MTVFAGGGYTLRMPIRRVDIVLPEGRSFCVSEMCGQDIDPLDTSEYELRDGRRLVSLLLDADAIEGVLDRLQQRFEDDDSYRVAVLEVVARLPDPEANGESEQTEPGEQAGDKVESGNGRISRNELVEQLRPGTRVSRLYLLTVFLSAVIAAVGLVRDSAAVVIGAMVIAPLLLPNMSLALATTLGDVRMALRSLLTNIAGVGVVLGFGLAIGFVLPFDESVRQVQMRTEVGLSDIAVALAAGAAGAVAVTSGVSANLIGVMVAVALLPPMVALALLLGAGHWELARGTAILLAVNVSCVNLAAVATFLVRGIRPTRDEDHTFARSAAMIALAMWLIVVALTAVLIWFSGAIET